MSASTKPSVLYKYCSFNAQRLDTFQGKIFFASPDSFNDPLDCNLAIDIKGENFAIFEEACRLKVKQLPAFKNDKSLTIEKYLGKEDDENIYHVNIKKILNVIYEELNKETNDKHGVFCLAEKNNCNLMWSHYGDQHKGLCIEYNLSKINPELIFDKIDYDPPRAMPASILLKRIKLVDEGKESVKEYDEIVKYRMFKKAKLWEYEHEWRIISVEEKGVITSHGLTISGVYFGLKCNKSVIATVLKILGEYYPRIKFYKMEPVENTFDLEPKEILPKDFHLYQITPPLAMPQK